MTEVDPVNLPPVLTVADALDPASLRADIEHIKWVLFQTRERTGGGSDTISELEDNNNGDNALIAQVAYLSSRIGELESQSVTREIPNLLKKVSDLESQLSTVREVPSLLMRISDLESQLSRVSELPVLSKRISDLEIQQ